MTGRERPLADPCLFSLSIFHSELSTQPGSSSSPSWRLQQGVNKDMKSTEEEEEDYVDVGKDAEGNIEGG